MDRVWHCSQQHAPAEMYYGMTQISDVKSSDLLAKRMRLVGADNPDFAVDKAALPPVPPRPEVAATATAPLPRPPPSEPPGAAPIPQESVVLPGAFRCSVTCVDHACLHMHMCLLSEFMSLVICCKLNYAIGWHSDSCNVIVSCRRSCCLHALQR